MPDDILINWTLLDRARRNPLVPYLVAALVACCTLFLGAAGAIQALLGLGALKLFIDWRVRKMNLHPSLILHRSDLITRMDSALSDARKRESVTGAMIIALRNEWQPEDDLTQVDEVQIENQQIARLRQLLRPGDTLGLWSPYHLAIVFSERRRLDIAAALDLAHKIQDTLNSPLEPGAGQLPGGAFIGFCLSSRLPESDGQEILQAAAIALGEARRHAPGAIRSYSAQMNSRLAERERLSRDIQDALANGEIYAMFQPQVDAQSGAIVGVEALARWNHPQRGMIPPNEFLPVLSSTGRLGMLGDVMIRDSLKAIRHWRDLRMDIPRVGVNFTADELRDPGLPDRIGFELERFSLDPSCLNIEVLETVVANPADTVLMENLKKLSEMGCPIDLDDFGTGHASITNIRMFSIARIKIDRSFISGIDCDRDKQDMISAITLMAERLNLTTLAEGVENAAEYECLCGLGVHHVQGFEIARPLARNQVDDWILARQETEMKGIGRLASA